MRKPIYMTFLLLCAVAYTSVSCAVTKVPVTTHECEKAVLPTTVEFSANFHGAIIKFIPNYDWNGGAYVAFYAVKRIVWSVDETFYSNGYRAKLSKAVKEVIVPPDSKNKIFLTQLKQC